MASKVPAKVQEIQEYCKKPVPRVKNISFSQLSMYLNCPKCWERSYVRKEMVYEPSIHTCFGTAFHETLQLKLQMSKIFLKFWKKILKSATKQKDLR